jgi:hypothetical protein
MAKRYYILDSEGRQLASYARNQPHIEGLIKLDEAPSNNHRWDGSNWVTDNDRSKTLSLEKIDDLIATNIHKFSRRLNFNAILALYDTYKDAIEAATTETDIQDAETALMDDLYSE